MINISMSKFTILIILVAILAAQQAAAQPPTKPTYFTEFCRTKMGNYTTNSTYEANVLSVLTDLYAQSSNASFANTSAGSGSASQVFGQYYCRGDINSSLCNDCVKEAAQTVFVRCHNFKAAVVWFEECTLRYDNVSMVGVEAELPNSYVYSTLNVTDPNKFGAVVNETIEGLINESANGGVNSSFFATGEGVVSSFETAFCLVQCSPDLNSTECDTCLRSAYLEFVPQWWPQSVLGFYPSCQLRYSNERAFYQVQNAPPPEATAPSATPPSSSPPPPPPVTTASPPTGGSEMLRSMENLNLGLVFSAVAFALMSFG